MAWQRLYRISSFGHLPFQALVISLSLHCKEKQTVASHCKSEGRLIEEKKYIQFYIREPLCWVLLFLYIYVLPHMFLILFTFVNKHFTVLFQLKRQKNNVTVHLYLRLHQDGTTTKLQSFSLSSSFFFTVCLVFICER